MDNLVRKALRVHKYPILFIVVFFFIVTVPLYFYYLQYNHVIKLTEDKFILQKQQLIFYIEKSLTNTRELVSRTINLMAQGSEIKNYVTYPSEENKRALEKFWIFIAKDQQTYSQIRFLDTQGQEMVRINYNAKQKRAHIAQYLQNKAQRPYFKMATSLKSGEKGIYALDLEKENGEYVRPYQAAYRIMMPVEFDGTRYGYMIINLDVQQYIKSLSEFREDMADVTLFNPQGYYVLGTETHKLHGDILPERKTFNLAKENPGLWQYMLIKASGEYRDEDAIYIFKRIPIAKGKNTIVQIALTKVRLEDVIQSQSDVLNGIKLEGILILLFLLSLSIPFVLYLTKIEQRRLQNRLVSAAMQGISAIVVTDKSNRIIKVNQEFTQITGYSEQEVLGKDPKILKSGQHEKEFYAAMWDALIEKGEWEGEISNLHKNGELITQLCRIRTVNDKGKIINYIASFVDISDRKLLEDKLRNLSERDALTNLWNRRVFEQSLSFQSKEIQRYSTHHFCSLAVLDIDFFKKVNDTYGHQKGDEVIQQVSDLLVSDSRDVDTVARIGGEEFAMILPHTHLKEATMLLDRIRTKIEASSDIGVTISAGVVELSTECLGEDAYKAADMALYKAKESGRNRVCS